MVLFVDLVFVDDLVLKAKNRLAGLLGGFDVFSNIKNYQSVLMSLYKCIFSSFVIKINSSDFV